MPKPSEGRVDGETQDRSGLSESRRRELADFLRTRREKLKPEQLGITQLSRRRTPGLRREEVAEIAGVGTTWYTWLEQARDIQPSAEVLKRLAQALMMNPAETRHMFTLAGRSAPVEVEKLEETPSASLLRILQTFQMPAVLLGSRWDVLAVNEATKQTFPHVASITGQKVNWLHFFFKTIDSNSVVNWETAARQLISDFRSSMSDALDQPWVVEIVESLRKENERFDSFWRDHDVSDGAYTLVEFNESSPAGAGRYERTMLRAAEDPRLSIVLYNQAH
ncbi:MAG: XRE family transcriptional regulator [Proteobacteria bacterium]|nr:MAG: XRE family transcriptional regulator [Pseudomonadota bacterium]